jgi:GH35 family endo-1,4-beta-xylanase
MKTNYNEYKHRMSTKKIVLKGMDGNPLKNAEVVVQQKKHKFLFGCAEFSSIPLANDELEGYEKEKAEERFEKFFDLFNYSTLPFYWENFEQEKGRPDTKRIKKTAEWFLSKGCVLKGHPLCWHTLAPPWLLDMDNSEILTQQLNRIKREVTDFRGLVDIWDVINEAVIMPVFNKYDNGITRICKDMGRINTVRKMFSEAKKSNPDATLLINDFVYISIDSYEILIEGCLEAGIPIDAIGIQSHMHQGYWGVEKILEILERFSQFNLRIHFTENTLVSGHTMPPDIVDFNDYIIDQWPSTPEGEERQAKEAAMHYKTLFKHPKVESITWWDFIDGQWLGAPVGLMTQDNRLKPVYNELFKLIKGEWWTEPVHTVTDDSGSITLSGFLGEYEAVCLGRKGTFVLDKGNEETEIHVNLSTI